VTIYLLPVLKRVLLSISTHNTTTQKSEATITLSLVSTIDNIKSMEMNQVTAPAGFQHVDITTISAKSCDEVSIPIVSVLEGSPCSQVVKCKRSNHTRATTKIRKGRVVVNVVDEKPNGCTKSDSEQDSCSDDGDVYVREKDACNDNERNERNASFARQRYVRTRTSPEFQKRETIRHNARTTAATLVRQRILKDNKSDGKCRHSADALRRSNHHDLGDRTSRREAIQTKS
jgi:hypothetical protein